MLLFRLRGQSQLPQCLFPFPSVVTELPSTVQRHMTYSGLSRLTQVGMGYCQMYARACVSVIARPMGMAGRVGDRIEVRPHVLTDLGSEANGGWRFGVPATKGQN